MLEELYVFLNLAETKSFNKTAKLLKLSPATVTRRIFALEEKLGVKVLKRDTRNLHLTQEGWYCYERMKDIPHLLREVKSDVQNSKGQLQGEINLSVSVYSAFNELIPVISSFLESHPKVKINFVKSNIHPEILDESFDMFIRYHEVNTRVFQSKPLKNYDLVIAATPEYLKKHGNPTKPQDLGEHNCIIHRVNAHEGEIWHFVKKHKEIPIRVTGNLSLNNTHLVLEALLMNVGLAKLPRFLIKNYLEKGQLIEVLSDFAPPPLTAHLIFPRKEYISGRVQVLTEFILNKYSC